MSLLLCPQRYLGGADYPVLFRIQHPASACRRPTACARRALEGQFYLELKEELLEPLIHSERLAIISVVGDGMRTLRGISAKFFAALAAPTSISWRLPGARLSVLSPS